MTSQLSKRVTIDIEPDLYKKLTLKAAQDDCSVSDIVHEAVYLAHLHKDKHFASDLLHLSFQLINFREIQSNVY